MRKDRILMALVMFCALIGIAAAVHADGKRGKRHEPKPDSIVTCLGLSEGLNSYLAVWVTVPIPVNLDACTFPHNTCSPCIRSLEEQGCKVLDATVATFPPASDGAAGGTPPGSAGQPRASFLLSCA